MLRFPDHVNSVSNQKIAFHPEENPLNVPLVQVSLFHSEDPDMHYRLGQAVASLRDENIVIIGAGMSVHNLRDMWKAMGQPHPMPYAVSFDEALKDAAEAVPEERQARMAEATKRIDARQAHPVRYHVPCHISLANAIHTVDGPLDACIRRCRRRWRGSRNKNLDTA